ncbi:MAG: hypothetical protein ACOCXZ_01050 [Chloroflexota bacterium]
MKRLILSLAVLLLALLPGVAAAQGPALTETYTFPSGATANYPAAWEVVPFGDGRDSLRSDDSIVSLFDPASLEERGIVSPDLTRLLAAFFPGWDYTSGVVLELDDVVVTTIEGREMALYDFIDSFGDEALLVAVRFSDGTAGIVSGLTVGGALTERDTIIAIATTFDYPAEEAQQPGNQGVGLSGALSGIAGTPGTVTDLDPVSAGSTYMFDEGVSVTYDDARWQVIEQTEDGLILSDDETRIALFTYYARTLEQQRLDTPEDVMAYDFETLEVSEFYDATQVTAYSLGDLSGARYDYLAVTDDGDQFDVTVLVLPLDYGGALRVRVVPEFGTEITDFDAVEAILETLDAPAEPVINPPAAADDPLVERYTFEGDAFDITFSFPESWEAVADDEGFVRFFSDFTTYLPGWFTETRLSEEGIDPSDLTGVLELYFFPSDETLAFDPNNVKVQTIDGRSVARYDYIDTDEVGSYTSTLLAAEVDGGYVLLAQFFPRYGERTIEGEAALRVFLSGEITLR